MKNDLDDFVDFFGSIPGFMKCNKDDAVGLVKPQSNDPGYQILDDDEIISLIKNEDGDHSNNSKASIHRTNLRLRRHSRFLMRLSNGSKDKKNVA